MFRIAETVHLRKRCPSCPVDVSGHSPTVETMAKVRVMLGVREHQIEFDGNAQHTARSAANLASRLGKRPFFLVTSAGHMPRALAAFRARGMAPLPARTDYRASRDWKLENLLPTPRYLQDSDMALREYLALL